MNKQKTAQIKISKIGKVSQDTLGYPFSPETESVGGSIKPRYRP